MLTSSRTRLIVDWTVTIVGAIAIVLALKAWVVNPYRIPSSSMAPTLACGRTSADAGCRAHFSDRVLADRLIYRFRDPRRGEIVVFRAPAKARRLCNDAEGSVFVKRVVGLPGETLSERGGWIYVDGKRLPETYLARGTRRADAA